MKYWTPIATKTKTVENKGSPDLPLPNSRLRIQMRFALLKWLLRLCPMFSKYSCVTEISLKLYNLDHLKGNRK